MDPSPHGIQAGQQPDERGTQQWQTLYEAAVREREEAEHQRQVALARGLAAQAELLHARRPDLLELSCLLSVEALQRFPCPVADQALRTSMGLLRRRLAILRHEDGVTAVAFSPDGRLLATASEDGTAVLWEPPSGKRLTTLRHADLVMEDPVMVAAFSPDGHMLATANWDGTAVLWEVAGGKRLAVLWHDGPVAALAFSPDGRLLATASRDAAVLWEVASGGSPPTVRDGTRLWAVAFTPDGRCLAAASDDQTTRLWEVASGKLLATLQQTSSESRPLPRADQDANLHPSRDRMRALEASPLPGQLAEHLGSVGNTVQAVTLSPDGRLLATITVDGTITLWEVESGKRLPASPLSMGVRVEATTSMVAFSPDGRLLATASWASWDGPAGIDGITRLWDMAGRKVLATLQQPKGGWAVAFGPDGRVLATAGWDGTIVLWDATSGQSLATPTMQQEAAVRALAFSPDGQVLAATSEDGTAALWDATSGERMSSLRHNITLWGVAFSPDGRFLATASNASGTTALWEVASGKRLATLQGGGAWHAVAFSPDGRFVATAGGAGTATLWLWRPEDLIAKAQSLLSRNLTLEEWQQYIGDEPYRKTCPNLP